MRSDTASGGRLVVIVDRGPFDHDEGVTVQEMAVAHGCDVEEAMLALIEAGCRGFVETDLALWRPRATA